MQELQSLKPKWSSYKPHRKQVLVHLAKSFRFVLINAGRRGGKSTGAAAEFYDRYCLDWENHGDGIKRGNYSVNGNKVEYLKYYCIAPDYSLCQVQHDMLIAVFPENLIDKQKSRATAPQKIVLKDKTMILFKSAERPEKLVAVGLFGLWVDEWSRCKAAFWQNIRPALSDFQGWCIGTSTPQGEDHWHDMWQLGNPENPDRDPQYASFWFESADNPGIDPGEIEAARRQLTPEDFAINYMADFGAFVGKIYGAFTRAKHVVSPDDIPPVRDRQLVLAALDFGDTDALSCHVYILDFEDRLWAVDEYYKTQMLFQSDDPEQDTVIKKLRELKAKWNISEWYCDPSGASFIRMMKAAKLGDVMKAKNEIWPGIVVCRTIIHNDWLRVSSVCKELIRQLNSYRKTDRYARNPDSNQDDHAVDDFRYAVTGVFGTDIAKIVVAKEGYTLR